MRKLQIIINFFNQSKSNIRIKDYFKRHKKTAFRLDLHKKFQLLDYINRINKILTLTLHKYKYPVVEDEYNNNLISASVKLLTLTLHKCVYI